MSANALTMHARFNLSTGSGRYRLAMLGAPGSRTEADLRGHQPVDEGRTGDDVVLVLVPSDVGSYTPGVSKRR